MIRTDIESMYLQRIDLRLHGRVRPARFDEIPGLFVLLCLAAQLTFSGQDHLFELRPQGKLIGGRVKAVIKAAGGEPGEAFLHLDHHLQRH